MKAALCKSLDGPSAVTVDEVPDPTAGPGEAVVEVAAVALNFFDTLITRGKYQVRPELPFSPGGEIAGVVVEAGAGVASVRVGQRVAAYVGHGGARERVTVAAERLIAVPDGVSDEVAATLNITYGTAMHGLVDRARLAAGETVAVLGAAGGAGLAAVEVAHCLGARVIAAARGADRLEICRRHGADEVIDYDGEDLRGRLRALTEGRGPDVIYDCVGGAYAEPALRAMAWAGRYAVIGFAAGQIPQLPLNVVLLKGCDVVGVHWGEAVARDARPHTRAMGQVLGWIAEGRIVPRIDRTLALGDIVAGLEAIDRREVTGKIVVRI